MAESTVRDGDKGIDLLKSKIGQPLSANRFVVEFEKLPKPFEGLQNDYLRILCQSASIAGKSIGTNDLFRHYKLPDGTVDYGDTMSFEFICDQNFLDRQIIEEWLRMIHTPLGYESRTILNADNNNERPEGHGFSFYNDYIGTAAIHVLRKDGTRASTQRLHDCYVSGYDDISLDMDTGSEGGPMTFSFELTYRYHTMDNSNGGGDVSLNANFITSRRRSGETELGESAFQLNGLNKGRRIFDGILQGLKVAGRFNSKLGDLGRRLGSYDTAITRASNIGRDLGINSEFITQKRRGD